MDVETAIAPIRQQVCRVEPDLSVDDLMNVRGLLDNAKRQIKELADELEQRCITWIEANGDIEIGDVRWYVGVDRTEKCEDLRGTVEAALRATGGDVDEFTNLLSANAFKAGATRKTLPPDVYERLFKTTVKTDLKEGKPVKRLQRFDKRFAV